MTDAEARLGHGRRWKEGRALLAAATFLTRVPLAGSVVLDGEDLARAGPGFAVVGAGIGAAVGASADALARPLTPTLGAVVAVVIGAGLTGALHLDGLADTADALGGRSRSRALEIMRDHAVGAYGAVAIGLDLLIMTAALAALAARQDALPYAVVAGALSRTVAVLLAAALPYARSGGGAGASLTGGGRERAVVAALLATAIAAGVAGVDGLVGAAVGLGLAILCAAVLRRWLGGVTGDALGAAVELTELAILVVAVALVGGR